MQNQALEERRIYSTIALSRSTSVFRPSESVGKSAATLPSAHCSDWDVAGGAVAVCCTEGFEAVSIVIDDCLDCGLLSTVP